MEIDHYLKPDGHDVVQSWLDGLKDMRARVAVLRRIDRLKAGNFGDCKFCRDGVREVRVDIGGGYRVYYAQVGRTLLLLLCGGDKRTQSADIGRAAAYLKDWEGRM